MTTDWLSAIGILLSGLVIGFMFVYASMRKRQEGDDLDRRDLEAKRDALIEQLRAFFKPNGVITQTCNGPCVFDMPM